MDILEKNLKLISQAIKDLSYIDIETDRFELKDLSKGWGEDWYKTVCAFLNTNGGIIVIGISDKKNSKPSHYKFTGYINSDENEKHLTQILPHKFTNQHGEKLNLEKYFNFKILPFLDGNVAVVYIEELEDDLKYVFLNKIAYKRKLTGDYQLSAKDIEEYEEVKNEIIKDKELSIVPNSNLELIDIEKLNNFITRFNKGKKKGETLKTDIYSAISFLKRQNFIFEDKPTLLGMLICGNYLVEYLNGKCEVDCYVINENSTNKVQSKEVFYDNITELIESSFNFIWRNIQVGLSYANSGTAIPEYPEELLRESINNALAHRDYISDRFAIVELYPSKKLVIRNPGKFGLRQLINQNTELGKVKRIIPIQVSRNPKLTSLLKSFNYWEGRGSGLSSLIDNCLDNIIDIPYYSLSSNEIKLTIPKGKVFDDEMEILFSLYQFYIYKKLKRELNKDEKIILSYLYKSEILNKNDFYTILLTQDNNHTQVISNLVDSGLIILNNELSSDYSIYSVDRIFFKNNFYDELNEIFENKFDLLNNDTKEILNYIYLIENFGNKNESISANSIGKIIYIIKNKNIINLNDFDNFKRKVRNIFNKLENDNLIIRKDGKTKLEGGKPNFVINVDYINNLDQSLQLDLNL